MLTLRFTRAYDVIDNISEGPMKASVMGDGIG